MAISTDKTRYNQGDIIKVSGSGSVFATQSMQLQWTSDPYLLDPQKNRIRDAMVDQQTSITSSIRNTQNFPQEFVYFVEVKKNGIDTVSVNWITFRAEPNESFTQAIDWIPTSIGQYTATVFVWDSLNQPTELLPKKTISFNVRASSPGLGEPPSTTPSNLEETYEEITLRVINPMSNVIHLDQIRPDSNGNFFINLDSNGILWNNPGTYKISIMQNSLMESVTFEILAPVICSTGFHEENGQCVRDPLNCGSGSHEENGQCVRDQQIKDPDYTVPAIIGGISAAVVAVVVVVKVVASSSVAGSSVSSTSITQSTNTPQNPTNPPPVADVHIEFEVGFE